MTYDLAIVLGNLMDVNGSLNDESRGRVDLGCELITGGRARRMMTCGWAYRPDTSLTIAQAMATYAEGKVPKELISLEPRSRDTVGDAVFSRLACGLASDQIVVATSAYHAARTAEIFGFVYGGEVRTLGAPGEFVDGLEATELASTSVFRSTFLGVAPGDLEAIVARLRESHPFYNGAVYPRI